MGIFIAMLVYGRVVEKHHHISPHHSHYTPLTLLTTLITHVFHIETTSFTSHITDSTHRIAPHHSHHTPLMIKTGLHHVPSCEHLSHLCVLNHKTLRGYELPARRGSSSQDDSCHSSGVAIWHTQLD